MLAYLWSRCSGGSTAANPPHIHTHILTHIHTSSCQNIRDFSWHLCILFPFMQFFASPSHLLSLHRLIILLLTEYRLLILKYDLYYIPQNVFLSIYSHLNKDCSYTHYFHKIPQVFSNPAFTLMLCLNELRKKYSEKQNEKKKDDYHLCPPARTHQFPHWSVPAFFCLLITSAVTDIPWSTRCMQTFLIAAAWVCEMMPWLMWL